MLLDVHALRSSFSQLLPNPPATFAKRVTTAFGKIDPLLKTLQVRSSPPEALVQAYLIHVADRNDANFRKILDLKGLRAKIEQNHLVELFQMHKTSERYGSSLVEKSQLLTPIVISGHAATATGAVQGLGVLGTTAAASISTASLPGKFDPTVFGNAIMSAARDGVDRFGSPSLGGATPRDGAQSPPPQDGAPAAAGTVGGVGAGGNLNENLKNIGKFFRRDLGGFGGRFGKGQDDGK